MEGKKYPGWKIEKDTIARAIIIPSRAKNSFSFCINGLPHPPAISGILFRYQKLAYQALYIGEIFQKNDLGSLAPTGIYNE